jgi:hypothetical protein
MPKQMKKRPVVQGSFNVANLVFSSKPDDYALPVTLAPARTQCLCCGGTAGSRSVITAVALGTSAAVKVIGEGLVETLAQANRGRDGHDGKERLLIFSDSRQDAAHQARFIIFASRYDRMRRRVAELLQTHGPLSIQRTVELLGDLGSREHDNPYAPADADGWIDSETRERMQYWEEAPLLDELAVNAGYRATLVNLGVMGVRYDRLDEYIRKQGAGFASRIGLSAEQLEHICRSLLDEMRTRGTLSRKMLQYHPQHPACPAEFAAAQWERRVKEPRGYACTDAGKPLPFRDSAELPTGITLNNAWRRPGAGGRGPSLERLLKHFCEQFGAATPTMDQMVELLDFLARGRFLLPVQLFGARQSKPLLQVNAEAVRLYLVEEPARFRCSVCGYGLAGSQAGLPCPYCHGFMVPWPDAEVEHNRTVRRIKSRGIIPLVAGEHTAQVTNDERIKLEENFKAGAEASKVNVLACSPTLEMGIDVGGLDAVVLRNVPPRPDNYAQRGGRAGRRSRVGLVLGYARSTPHDQYFYDKPAEMISGEVPAPAFNLTNRDVLLRHLAAIAFGAADPGLSGRMVEYVSPTGEIKHDAVEALAQAVLAQTRHAMDLAKQAWGESILSGADLDENDLRTHLESLPARIQDAVNRTSRQVRELHEPLSHFSTTLERQRAANRAAELVARLLGIQTERQRGRTEADDRSAGYPLRRFAEFGILPGYEFPTEPASLRMLGDEHEEDPVTVARVFGIAQFQPDAQVYARAKRWKVVGLDTGSPWNPRAEDPSWMYRVCQDCQLRYRADHPRCPRCSKDAPGRALPAYEFGGFLGRRDENSILDEEERFATRNLVKAYPQWDGDVIGRWTVGPGWGLRLSRGEEVQWVNEGFPPKAEDLKTGIPLLHQESKGFLVCPSCGAMLRFPEPVQEGSRGRRQPRRGTDQQDQYGHRESCPHAGAGPRPLAIATSARAEVLRLVVAVPTGLTENGVAEWGLSLGYSLHMGMRHLYMLDGRELVFELEGPWSVTTDGISHQRAALTFIDASLGGTGYLRRIAEEFHFVARRAREHLDHSGCETACYRCLKAYDNQRYHALLHWPRIVSDLDELAVAGPTAKPLEVGDIDDPRPWLEAYEAGVGSPLELKFLRLFEQHGFHPEKQVPIAAVESEPPISTADFAVPAARLAIYVVSVERTPPPGACGVARVLKGR